MELKQLRTFLCVADLGSLRWSAEWMHIAQPALGRQIKMLEGKLQVSLFVRHGRGMALTSVGKILADWASAMLRLAEETRAEISADGVSVKGNVNLAVTPTAEEVIAGPVVERIMKLYPNVMVRIVSVATGYAIDMLQRGEIDFAIMYEAPAVRQLKVEPLLVDFLSLVGPRNRSDLCSNPFG